MWKLSVAEWLTQVLGGVWMLSLEFFLQESKGGAIDAEFKRKEYEEWEARVLAAQPEQEEVNSDAGGGGGEDEELLAILDDYWEDSGVQESDDSSEGSGEEGGGTTC